MTGGISNAIPASTTPVTATSSSRLQTVTALILSLAVLVALVVVAVSHYDADGAYAGGGVLVGAATALLAWVAGERRGATHTDHHTTGTADYPE